ncbi:MAG: hypothetical protein ABJ013_10215 [Halioglobus sp.]
MSESNGKVQILNLTPSGVGGCSPEPAEPVDWKPKKKSLVAIVNSSGADQTLSNITVGMLKDQAGKEVTHIDVSNKGFWLGTVEQKKGTYEYDDGETSAGPRTGRIDPS